MTQKKALFIPSYSDYSDHGADALRYSIEVMQKKFAEEQEKMIMAGIGYFKYLPRWLLKKIFRIEKKQNDFDFGYTLKLKRFGKTIKTIEISGNTFIKN